MTFHQEYITVKQFLKVVDKEKSIILSNDVKEKLKRTDSKNLLQVKMDIRPNETKIISLICGGDVLIEGGE